MSGNEAQDTDLMNGNEAEADKVSCVSMSIFDNEILSTNGTELKTDDQVKEVRDSETTNLGD